MEIILMRIKSFSTSILIMINFSIIPCIASNLANPVAPIPTARIGIGLSYHLGGHTVTNREIPSLMNRFHARFSYAPSTYLNFGFDLGTSQMDVASDTSALDTLLIFHGKYGFSYGAHLKLSTPLILNDIVGLIGIFQGTRFFSENDEGAYYSGYDAAGAAGLLFHIPGFGYIAAGSKVYLIAKGRNKSYNSGVEHRYSNINNVRGWLAIDYFPKIKSISETRPYISFELSISPDAKVRDRAPIQEVSISIAIGSITKRLYGEESDVEWEP